MFGFGEVMREPMITLPGLDFLYNIMLFRSVEMIRGFEMIPCI